MQRYDPWDIVSPAIALDHTTGFRPAVGRGCCTVGTHSL